MFLKSGFRLTSHHLLMYAGNSDGSHQPSSGSWLCYHEKNANPVSHQPTCKSCYLCLSSESGGWATGRYFISHKMALSAQNPIWDFFFPQRNKDGVLCWSVFSLMEVHRTLLLEVGFPTETWFLDSFIWNNFKCPEHFQPIFLSTKVKWLRCRTLKQTSVHLPLLRDK